MRSYEICLGKLDRKHCRPLLPLGPIGSYVCAIKLETDVITVWTDHGYPSDQLHLAQLSQARAISFGNPVDRRLAC
jgi:hypothetical protein